MINWLDAAFNNPIGMTRGWRFSNSKNENVRRADLREKLHAMDKDRNGKITKEEFSDGAGLGFWSLDDSVRNKLFRNGEGENISTLTNIFMAADRFNKGCVDASELNVFFDRWTHDIHTRPWFNQSVGRRPLQ